MKVAALYDVHGNLPALEAVLAESDVQHADRVVAGGDIVTGPFPRETLAAFLDLGYRAAFLRGNCERELVEPPHASLWGRRTEWVREQLLPEQIERLAALPHWLSLDVEELGPVRFCHGTPRSDDEIVTAATPEHRLREVAVGIHELTVVCGHTHVQFDRSVGGVRFVNAGSVGMAYENRPGAYWALLGEEIELRRTEYDLDAAATRIRAGGFPEPDELIQTLRSPPSAEEATVYFERAAAERGER